MTDALKIKEIQQLRKIDRVLLPDINNNNSNNIINSDNHSINNININHSKIITMSDELTGSLLYDNI